MEIWDVVDAIELHDPLHDGDRAVHRKMKDKLIQAKNAGEIVKYEELMTQYGATRISFTHSPLRIG